MNKKVFSIIASTIMMFGLGLSSCSDNGYTVLLNPDKEDVTDEPGSEEPEKPIDQNLPTDVSKIAPRDLEMIRAIMKDNGLSSKVSSDNPHEWDMENLYFGFEPDADSVYYLTSITGTGQWITSLNLMYDETQKGLDSLKVINITNLELVNEINIGSLPSLKELRLDGDKNVLERPNHFLSSIYFQKLPELETLRLANFDKLEKNGTTDIFQISLYHGNDKLKSVELENLGIIGVNVSTREPLEHFDLKGDMSKLQNLYLDEVKMPELKFSGEQYPALTNLKLVRLPEGSDTKVVCDGLKNLTSITIQDCKTIDNAVIKNLEKTDMIYVSGSGVTNLDFASLPLLKELDISDNDLTAFDASPFTNLKLFDIGHNNVARFEDLSLPHTVGGITLTGNEAITRVDLSDYAKLEYIRCRGMNKELTESGSEVKKKYPDMGALVEVLLPPSAPELFSVLVDFNRLTEVKFNMDGDYKSLERVYMESNRAGINEIAHVRDLIDTKQLDVSRSDFTYAPQYDVPVKVENNKADYSYSLTVFEPNFLDIKLYTDVERKQPAATDAYTFDKTTGILEFLKPGTYYANYLITSKILRDFGRRKTMVSDAIEIK